MAPDLPPATSASQLVQYAMCPRKYAFSYVYGFEPEFRSTALVLGSAMHSAIAWWFAEKLDGRRPTLDQADGVLSADLLAGSAGTDMRWKDATPLHGLVLDCVRAQDVCLVRRDLFGERQRIDRLPRNQAHREHVAERASQGGSIRGSHAPELP